MLNVACFVQSCLTDADFVIFSNYCLIGTRLTGVFFAVQIYFPGHMRIMTRARARAAAQVPRKAQVFQPMRRRGGDTAPT